MCQMANSLIKILPNLKIDFTFCDKILVNMNCIDKDNLLTALNINKVQELKESKSMDKIFKEKKEMNIITES